MRSFGVVSTLLALMALVVLGMACGATSDDPSAGSGVPRDVFQAIGDHIRNSGLSGGAGGALLAGDCETIGAQAAICVDAEASTVLASEATVRLYDNLSQASWDVSLVKRDEGWLVTNVADVGPR